MKKLLLVLSISFLLQSCFSYKEASRDPTQMVLGEKYKIRTNQTVFKVVLISVSDGLLVVQKNKNELQIPLQEITSLKKRKFSLVKTISIIPLTAIGITAVFIIADPILK